MDPSFLLALSGLPQGGGTPGSSAGPGAPAHGGAFSRLLGHAASTLDSRAGLPAKTATSSTARSLLQA
ncbi:MAG: hypothetical protein GVY13_00045, partial [Alphaproteobacteria bacterium]|nr:hypothetical protein [Alphaproteobacteria bacterium]